MGITVSGGGFDGLADSIRNLANERAEDAVADTLVEKARELGLDSVDSIVLQLTVDSSELKIDEARARAKANEILAGS